MLAEAVMMHRYRKAEHERTERRTAFETYESARKISASDARKNRMRKGRSLCEARLPERIPIGISHAVESFPDGPSVVPNMRRGIPSVLTY